MESKISPVNNLDLYKNALQTFYKAEHIKILTFSPKLASDSGSNYMSNIYRVAVTYQLKYAAPQNISLIVKHIVDYDCVQEFLNDHGIFVKEVEMYQRIFPKWNQLGSKYFSAKFFYYDGETKILILEDLSELGFKSATIKGGLDIDHCRLVIKQMANFHASSIILDQQESNVYENFEVGMFKTREKLMIDSYMYVFFKDRLVYLIEIAKQWPGFEKIVPELEFLNDNLMDKIFEFLEQPENPKLKCLNHGDLWISNMMFKYGENGKPTDATFLDFQFCFYKSMGIDWNLFMYSTPSVEVRENHYYELLNLYYLNFIETLRSLNCEGSQIPSFEELKAEIKNFEFYGLFASMTFLSLVHVEKKEGLDSNLEALTGENSKNEILSSYMGGHYYQQAVKLILKHFYTNGTLRYSSEHVV